MNILGVFGGYYNPAACLVCDGKLVAFIEEEKLTRKRREFDIMPVRAIHYCLQESGLSMKDVHRIAFPWDPHKNLTSMPFIALWERVKRLGGGTGRTRSVEV